MAGAGYRLFSTGEIPTQTDWRTYLMEQTVMVFASAAARTTALSGVLAEGMVSYLADTNSIEVYTGAAWTALLTDIAPTTSIVFEGATPDGFETMLSVVDPTADRTITLPDASGTVPLEGVALAAGGVVGTAANPGYMGIPQNAATTGAYTITAADNGKNIHSTASRTITFDSNANLALPKGFACTFTAGVGVTVTIAITTDTMYLSPAGTTGSRTLAAYGMATALKTDTTKIMISGSGLT
ncbi:hypothetical protein UFOVP1616_56 [uncultured Caudovirales phage]|uniref:Uncharacterized protein n=1 Tax=uncultured Caudovirales phage TaxID=2100421 RepID=A0A6J5SKE3_9CAUD|nr:hypothetical protein UFOVP1467_9 [uncultured Caudovirales phage]CAB4219675.1 hypothetical protein UFOVP1616_56 [uncultured Caudovirales phage]